MLRVFVLIVMISAATLAQGQTRVAVAANFERTAQEIADLFFNETGERVTLVTGSTGGLATQIRQGTGFDAFLAGDMERPQQLVETGVADGDSLFHYATGRLVLIADEAENDEGHGPEQALREESYRALALPDYRDSPYGKAAVTVLDEIMGSRFSVRRTVEANDVAQAFQFMRSGSVDLGFVALSQVREHDVDEARWWLIPSELHEPLHQGAVLVEDGSDMAREFLAFIREDERAHELIRNAGYELPDDAD